MIILVIWFQIISMHWTFSIKIHWQYFQVFHWQKSCNCNNHGSHQSVDCVDHEILLTKLKQYSVHLTPLRWISSSLSNNEHFISWNQIESILNLNLGVLRGSILGHLLFLMYISDSVSSSNVLSFVLFVDDTSV